MTVRFAPSPTGQFHLGNLRTAWISYQLAKKLNKKWVLRFEDIDKPRVVVGAQESQLADMQKLGLIPDEILVQSHFYSRHLALFKEFKQREWIYPCFCSRKQIRDALESSASAPHDAPIHYNGACRSLKQFPNHNLPTIGWRLKSDDPSGAQDFIIGRTNSIDDDSSFVPAYHWACAIDDYDGNYDLLVRAWDLESALPLQRTIQTLIAQLEQKKFTYPAVYYCSLVVQNNGQRLEKRTKGVTLTELRTQGVYISQVLESFHSSFNQLAYLNIAAAEILGEQKKELSIQDLLSF